MSEPPFSVCVFCASSDAVTAADRAVATELGAGIASRGWRLVYGGGGIGLMGEVARGALRVGGSVLGVIPERLVSREVALLDGPELIRTQTMRERKHHMDEASDAFVVLPGGIGTLEELVEILTLKQLGYHDRPIVLLDPDDHWAPLRRQLSRMVERRLSAPSVLELFEVATDVDGALSALTHARISVPHPTAAEEMELVEDVEESRAG
jgi:cytokinin riboside 5'-monophosphate phosphoribohydrolase